MNSLIIFLLWIPGIIIATTLHEFTRAAVSTALGDKKPKQDGRLTLNPMKHFEPIGFILMFATGFGWGKPVETSALYYRKRKRDTLLTAILPTIANLIVAVIFTFLYKRISGSVSGLLFTVLYLVAHYNITLAVYNITPISPMDGMKVLSCLLPANTYFKYLQYEKVIQMVFLFLLFMGTTNVIFNPIISLVTTLIDLITF